MNMAVGFLYDSFGLLSQYPPILDPSVMEQMFLNYGDHSSKSIYRMRPFVKSANLKSRMRNINYCH